MTAPMDFGSTQRIQTGNLILEGIPEIPGHVRDRLSPYQNMRAAGLCDWLATGDGLVISTRFAETAQLHVVHSAGGMRRQITFHDEPAGSVAVCPDPAMGGLLFTRDVGGSEFHQVFFLELATGDCRMLTDGASRNGGLCWSNRGDRFAFYTTQRNGRDHDLHVAGLDGVSMPVLEREGLWQVLDWSPDDTRLLVRRHISINECYLYMLELADGQLTELSPADEPVCFGAAAFTRDGREGVFFTSDAGAEFLRLRYVDLACGQISEVTDAFHWNVEDLALSYDGRWLALTTNEDGYSRLYLLRTATGEPEPVATPDGLIGSLRFSPDDGQVAMTISTPRSPSDVYLLDMRCRKLKRWTFSETAGVPEDRFVAPELVRYQTFDTVDGRPRTLPAFYYRPPGQEPLPVLIQIHGGPEGQSRPGFSSTVQAWVHELGLAVLVPNVRGSAGYGKSYLRLDNGRRREDSVRDIGALLDWIDSRPELDSGRVAVIGASYGGYMVLASLMHYGARLRAGVEMVGIANFVTFLEHTQAYRRDLRRAEYGDERDAQMREFLLGISPARHADKICCPLLIGQGLNDPRVPASESEQMIAEIRAAGGTVACLLACDEGHGFQKQTNRSTFEQATVLFLERYLL